MTSIFTSRLLAILAVLGAVATAATAQTKSLVDRQRDSLLASQHICMPGRDLSTASAEMRDSVNAIIQ